MLDHFFRTPALGPLLEDWRLRRPGVKTKPPRIAPDASAAQALMHFRGEGSCNIPQDRNTGVAALIREPCD
jgi:hypothetical protein